ncbi:hypothetical protein CQW23_25340 [Capsicum baccatum]|uniref:Amino acid transporter transmembrane domain-containing protein n=1 Tax=Capsicum baccatum TaxID=33114 RepID=A0A2G2VKP9_CAPBA|nr:hypothetical protein CQW23_25340 [Capsicum baccatum]
MLEIKFDMKDLGVTDVILGIRIHRTPQRLAFLQSRYIKNVLDEFKYMEFGISKTPLDVSEEVEWLWNFFEDIPYCPKLVAPVCIHYDSQAIIGRARSIMYNDPLTKGLSQEGVERTSKRMGLRPRTSQHGDSAQLNILWELTSSSFHALQISREYTPLIIDTRHLSSSFKTFTNVFIAVVEAGVLGLPYRLKKNGWLMGTIMLLLVASLTYHCMMLWCIMLGKILNPIIKLPRFHLLGDLGYDDAMIVLSQDGFVSVT